MTRQRRWLVIVAAYRTLKAAERPSIASDELFADNPATRRIRDALEAGMTRQSKVEKVMHEFKAGTLHSGKGGPVVRSHDQALAIALSEQRKADAKKKGKKR